MSVKLPDPTTGRRTPLSLGPTSQKQVKQVVVEITSTSTTTSESKSAQPPSKKNMDSIDLTQDDSKLKTKNIQNEKSKTDSPIKNTNVSAKDNINVTDKKEKTTKKDSEKTAHENGHKDAKDSKTNGHKEESATKKTDKNIAITSSRGSPRLKDVVKDDQKVKSVSSTSTPTEQEDKIKRSTPIEKDIKEPKMTTEVSKTIITEKIKKKTDEINISRRSVLQSAVNVTAGSIALQSPFQGFNDNDEEMESLLLDVDIPESATTIPTAAKHSNSSPSPSKKLSRKEKSEQLLQQRKPATPTTPQKLSVVEKEKQSVPENKTPRKQPSLSPRTLPAVDIPVTSTPDGKQFYTQAPSSLRSISGRKSLRPLKEYKFQTGNYHSESYRRLNTELDFTNNTSLNVTVGSEPGTNESFVSSFFSFGRGKKRERTPPPASATYEIKDDEMETNTASPKRARLDFVGLFGIVASPVTMIRNRLYRTKIQCSTPNENPDNEEEGVENVSGIILEEKNQPEKELEEDIIIKEVTENLVEKEKDILDLDENDDIDDAEEAEVESADTNRRGRCNVM